MESRPLGPDARGVSAVGYGAMLLSIDGRPDERQAVRALHAALDEGVTLIDTADVYSLDGSDIGHNERLIARALATWTGDRDRVVVATKGGSAHPEKTKWHPDGRPEHLRAACDASLRALGVERIDLYYLHTRDPNIPYEESLGAIAGLRDAGKIRWVGVSNVGLREIEAARRALPLQAVQNMLNPFVRDALRGRPWGRSILGHCAARGLAFVAHSPLGSWWSSGLPEHPVIGPIAARHGVSAHAVCLAWVLAQGSHVIAIPGARRPEHAAACARAAQLTLAPGDLAAIDAADFPRD